ncbi:MAG TPA: cation:proton antiporter [Candidatus Dormibacteraeota bacterium]|nr:cation:proton antiporter [Candidatus Dormibacteraeota bacterium]
MPPTSFANLLGAAVIAFAAPFLLGFFPRIRLPAVVLEIALGIVVGPAALGWLRVDQPVQIVAILGLAFLLFLAGWRSISTACAGACSS